MTLEIPCLLNQFSCLNGNCVPISYVGNGVDDCGDRSDETLMGNKNIYNDTSYNSK